MLEFDENDRYSLLYRGSRDGFSASNFHSKCDNIPNTLTIIKSGSNVFGGFTTSTWEGSVGYKKDSEAFIFSFRNNLNKPIKIKCKNTNSIFAYPSYGPTFGSGHDFYIASNSNQNTESTSNLGFSYPTDLIFGGSDSAKAFLAGSYNFKVNEIEVFAKKT